MTSEADLIDFSTFLLIIDYERTRMLTVVKAKLDRMAWLASHECRAINSIMSIAAILKGNA